MRLKNYSATYLYLILLSTTSDEVSGAIMKRLDGLIANNCASLPDHLKNALAAKGHCRSGQAASQGTLPATSSVFFRYLQTPPYADLLCNWVFQGIDRFLRSLRSIFIDVWMYSFDWADGTKFSMLVSNLSKISEQR